MNDFKRLFKLVVFCIGLLLQIKTSDAQATKNRFDIRLNNGKYMQVQVCSPDIVRIRLQNKRDFQESIMERYGILKNNWKPVATESKEGKGILKIQLANHQIDINQRTADISLKDLKGNVLIDHIGFSNDKHPIVSELGQSLNKYFGKAKTGGGIIGDSSYTGKQVEIDEVGDINNNSVLDISLKSEERFYGGGNTSRTNIQHRGTALRMWATYQKTEIPSPFIMSSNGWGIFNNTTAKNYFDVGRFQKDRLFIYNTDEAVDFYLMLGNSMPDAINLYTQLTGRPFLLPKWAYGLAFGGNTMEDQMDVMNDAVRFRDEKIPCDIFWLEPQWMTKNYDFSTSKSWNQDKFPGETSWGVPYFPKTEGKTLFVHKLHGIGFKLALWLCIDHDLTISEEDRWSEKNGKQPSGQEHWFNHLTNFIDQGVDGFKLDPGMTLDEHPDRKYFNGYTDKEMHNLTQVLLPKQLYETFREHTGLRSFHHYCGGYAGAQHWAASTSGDNGGGKGALFDQLNLGLSGFVNTSADVLEGVDDNKAGLHFGFFLPWVQINSWYSLHHPWYMPPIEKETFRFYAQLRNALSPYIYSTALEGNQTGMPILRAMTLVFPDDRKVDNMVYQYMFGENLLVGAFTDSIYLPKGKWINYWTGEKFVGDKTIHCAIPANRGGLLFIKAGAIIPYQLPMQYIGEHPTDTLILKVYPYNKSSFTLLEDDGKTYDYEKGNIAKTQFDCLQSKDQIQLIIQPVTGSYAGMFTARTYQLEIASPKKPTQVLLNNKKIANWKYDASGKILTTVNQKNNAEKLTITIIQKHKQELF